MEIHALTRGMMFLNACLGIENREVVFDLPVQQVHHRLVEKLLAQHGVKRGKLLVAIHPTAKWETKLWDNDKFSSLADALIQKHGVQVVFTGGRADGKRIQHIISPMKGHATNLSGQMTLKALAALYSRADCVVSTDTGPMHLAAAMGTPVVALFGPTAPWRTGPFGKNHQIICAGLDCSPCFKRKCSTKECMKQIPVEDVLNGIEKTGIA
jgi:lipopolysaccharide heptosyltransferase II